MLALALSRALRPQTPPAFRPPWRACCEHGDRQSRPRNGPLAGVEGVYARDEAESESIVGVPVQHEYEVIDDETGLPTKVISYDWRFITAELLIADELVTPRKGD